MESQTTVYVRRRDLRIALLLATCSFLYYLVFYHGHFCGSDEVHLFETTRSIVERGELTIPEILNSERGSDGRAYGRYEIGQSVLAIPFYLAGKLAAWALPSGWQTPLAGRQLKEGQLRWGGSIEIFATGLFAPFAAALLVAVFFWTERQLGASVRSAALTSAILGFCTYTATMSGYFLRHVVPAALLLAALGWLRRWRETRRTKMLLVAGVLLAVGVQTRMDLLLALPGLLFYAIWERGFPRSASRKEIQGRLLAIGQAIVLPVVISIALILYVNYVKWGRPMAAGGESIAHAFGTPLYVSLYGFLFSPGLGFFVYSPPALLVFSAWKSFWRKYRVESITIVAIASIFLLSYSAYEDWHGLWSAPGPRYLFILVPLLMLPAGQWLDGALRWTARTWVGALAIVGFIFQIPLMAVNFAYAYHFLGYADYRPSYSFLFVPDHSPLATSFRLFKEGYLVDSWLLNLRRGWEGTAGHPVAAMCVLAVILSLLVSSLWTLLRNVKEAERRLRDLPTEE